MNPQHSSALRKLPVTVQLRARNASKGSLPDLKKLAWGVESNPTLHEYKSALLPVFFIHLNPSNFNYIVRDNDFQTMLKAFHSLDAIAQTFKSWVVGDPQPLEPSFLNTILANVDLVHRWVVFFHDQYVLNPVVLEGQPIAIFDILSVLQQTFMSTFHLAPQHKHIMVSADVRRVFASLFHMAGSTKIEELAKSGSDSSTEATSIRVGLCTSLQLLTKTIGWDAALAAVTKASGGKAALAGCVIGYIRYFSAEAQDYGTDNEEWKTGSEKGTLLGFGFSYVVQFLHHISVRDGELREYFFSTGSVGAVTEALSGLVPPVLPEAKTQLLKTRLIMQHQSVEPGFQYIIGALTSAHNGERLASQAVSRGIIETILRCAVFAFERALPGPRKQHGDYVLLAHISCYFIYKNVLRQADKALKKINNSKLEVYVEWDPELRDLYVSVTERIHLLAEALDQTARVPAPINNQQCSRKDCSTPPQLAERLIRRCSGCSIATYCSKECQRLDWGGIHGFGCGMLRLSSGLQVPGTNIIRRNLVLISSIERLEQERSRDAVLREYAIAQQKYPADADKLALEMNMSTYPTELAFRPVTEYPQLNLEEKPWPSILENFRGTPGSTRRPPWAVIKVRQGHRVHILFSPAKTLRILYGWEVWQDDIGLR
ncbi:hypothetical protein HYDPIDRAFT_27816 [Hydnomerulius pinastri MD-312]|uniref:MYND-type domain-containing protein n=1 Tax=Hydnomerulius pinastri MD-312 TaxID=994086 RepID=A0A0C9WAQ9_9AGAM|nr:hypothetical protein HYDPIDRAFT_27816 [Hydnomerulius pinastri MD-312]